MEEEFKCCRCGHTWEVGPHARRCRRCYAAFHPLSCPSCHSRRWWLEVGREVEPEKKLRTYLRIVQAKAWRKARRGEPLAAVKAPARPPRQNRPRGRDATKRRPRTLATQSETE